jgi:hypothetical protein
MFIILIQSGSTDKVESIAKICDNIDEGKKLFKEFVSSYIKNAYDMAGILDTHYDIVEKKKDDEDKLYYVIEGGNWIIDWDENDGCEIFLRKDKSSELWEDYEEDIDKWYVILISLLN